MRGSLIRYGGVAVLALIAGTVLAFFGVGPSIFADGPWNERQPILFAVVFLYALLAFVGGYLTWRSFGLWLSLPGVLMVALLGLEEEMTWHITYVLSIVAASVIFASAGVWFRRLRAHNAGTS